MEPESSIRESVARVLREVRERGDRALIEFTERWDGVRLEPAGLRVPRERIEAAPVDSPFAEAFRRACGRIRRFHEAVRPRSVFVEEEGALLGMRWTPLAAVGLYVPGGKASYPSTLAMTAIPAAIAGVERIVVVSPPGPDGEVSPQVLLAARILGLTEIYRVGGAQAVAALAFGTETIPRVDKIFGPGNAYVAEAKRQLYGTAGIDLIAGPSEIVVYADESADPDWVAADLLAQAEHDESTRVTLLAASSGVLEAVRRSIDRLLASAPRRPVIEAALRSGGGFEVVGGVEEAARRIDAIAPEHLSLQVRDPWAVLERVRNAGAIFLGAESPVAVGDYYAGPNHVLPTGGTARFASCLSVEDFMKRSNVAQLTLDFVRRAAPDVEELARGEDLPAHALSVALRRRPDGPQPRPGLRRVTPYLLVEEEGEVKLNQNESPWDIPQEIKDEVARRLAAEPWNRYAQRIPSRFLARLEEAAGAPAGGVLAAAGSNLLLQWLFEAYGGPGRSALFPRPSFSLYKLWAEATETRAVEVSLRPDLSYSAEAFADRVSTERPSLVVLCLPNNPTGSEMAAAGLRRVLEAAREVGALCAIDEAYREFSDPAFDRTPLLAEYPNLVLVRTFSKAFAAAGMRLGYLVAQPQVAKELSKLVPPFHLSLFASVLGEVLLERRAYFEERVRAIVESRDALSSALRGIGGVEVFPSQANFFLFRVADPDAVWEGLRARGVLVRKPGGDPLLSGCLRVNAGTPEENARFLEALRAVLREAGR